MIELKDSDGKSYFFKEPEFDFTKLYIISGQYIFGQVWNNQQGKWKEKKWNKETGKVVGGGSNVTYFDLVPVTKEYDVFSKESCTDAEYAEAMKPSDVGIIAKSPKVCDINQYNLDKISLDAIDIIERYNTGKYDCYMQVINIEGVYIGWIKLKGLRTMYIGKRKLILKKHSFIADAVIANPDVEIEYETDLGWFTTTNFFEFYKENDNLRLKKQPKLLSENAFFRLINYGYTEYFKFQEDISVKKDTYSEAISDSFTVTETTCNLEIESDGSSNSFYVFPDYVCDVDSLCRYWNLSSAEGNILKSLTANLGSRHGGTDKRREVRKSLHYAIERMRWNEFSDEEIMAQVQKHFKK